MTEFCFDHTPQRKGTDCVKYDALGPWFGNPDLMPFWVADMDFVAPPFILEAIRKRADHGVFGYPFRPVRLYEALAAWLKRRQHWEIREEWILFSPGVVPALSMSVMALTQPGDSIIVQPPVYFPFFHVVERNQRILVNNPLRLLDGRLCMDFDDLEEKLQTGAKMIILSNPHNPGGSAWTRDELTRLNVLCSRFDCLVLSDEIHSDLVFSPFRHVPYASINQQAAMQSVTTVAPSKTFNLSGLGMSFMVIPNPDLRKPLADLVETLHLGLGNVFGQVAAEAAFLHGDAWLDELMIYLQMNVDFCFDFFRNHLPLIQPIRPEATYLIWLDCRKMGMDDDSLSRFFREKAGLALNDGTMFGIGGSGFMRLNIGCSKEMLSEGLHRLQLAFHQAEN